MTDPHGAPNDVSAPETNLAHAIFPAWSVLLEALATFPIPPKLLKTHKTE